MRRSVGLSKPFASSHSSAGCAARGIARGEGGLEQNGRVPRLALRFPVFSRRRERGPRIAFSSSR
jgi:hypothetical protein